jgi:hypothetical protein
MCLGINYREHKLRVLKCYINAHLLFSELMMQMSADATS